MENEEKEEKEVLTKRVAKNIIEKIQKKRVELVKEMDKLEEEINIKISEKIAIYNKLLGKFYDLENEYHGILGKYIVEGEEVWELLYKVGDQIYINTLYCRINLLSWKTDQRISEHDQKIESHDRNMLNIMGVLLAIFSLVGINMGMFGAIKEKATINQIITLVTVVNISLVSSMGALFTYIDHIFNRYKKKK